MADIPELLLDAVNRKASDIFLSAGKRPSLRIQGKLIADNGFPVFSSEEIDAFRLGVIGEAGEKEYLANGGFDASYTLGNPVRFRLNFFTSLNGPGLAVRPILSGDGLFFEELNLPVLLGDICSVQHGLILITGSTGCGKSTTLAAMINHINMHSARHILTIEDPVEFVHTDRESIVTQREVSGANGGYPQALKFALRENPDVIVIGELRDAATVQVAFAAAMTGHLVIATVHTTDTVQTVERLLMLFPETVREQMASDLGLALQAVVSQRLVPRADETGMIPAVEILLGTATVRKQIAERDYNALELTLKAGVRQGMTTFNRSLFQLYDMGIITRTTALAASGNANELDLFMKGMENGNDVFVQRYGSGGEDDEEGLVDMRTLFRAAVKNRASDMLLSSGTSPMLRLNGELRAMALPPLSAEDIERLLFSVISRQQRIALEEKRELDFALSATLQLDAGGPPPVSRFRVNAFYQRGSLGVVARVVPSKIPSPTDLLQPPVLVRLMDKKQGLILVTGPTGSGKSTTLASLLNMVNRSRPSHIITIEDPIEYVYDNACSVVEQRELHSDTLEFAAALKAAMRESPDIIMVGEMRDIATMSSALTAAETGHLVLATIHTNSAPQTVDRIIDSFPPSQQNQIRQQLSGALLGVISQRLLPRLDGCGRVAAFEVMIGTPPIQSLIREGKTHMLQSAIETASKDGMITLRKALELLSMNGLVSRKETLRFSADYKETEAF